MFDSCFRPPGAWIGNRRRSQGFVLFTTAAMVALVLLPAAGLAVDAGIMYLVQSRLSAACDAASLAGARALSRGSDDSTQRSNAETTANLYFAANFPPAFFDTTNLHVTNVAATDSTFMRSITSTASVTYQQRFLRASEGGGGKFCREIRRKPGQPGAGHVRHQFAG
jgi:Flp pilus assembly protein TadG